MPYCRLWILLLGLPVVDNQLLITMISSWFGPLVFGPFQIVLVENQSCTWVLPCFAASFICVNATSLEVMV
jgi:hypothetical protein